MRLLTLVIWVIVTVNFTNLNGLWIGAGAWSLTLLLEAVYAYFFGRKYLANVTLA